MAPTTKNGGGRLSACGILLLITLALPAYSLPDDGGKIGYPAFLAKGFRFGSLLDGFGTAAGFLYFLTLLAGAVMLACGIAFEIKPALRRFMTNSAVLPAVLSAVFLLGGLFGLLALSDGLGAEMGVILFALMDVYCIVAVWQTRSYYRRKAAEEAAAAGGEQSCQSPKE